MEGKHIFLNDQELNISGKITTSNHSIATEKMRISFGSGEVNLEAKYDGKKTLNTEIDLKNADMTALNSFLPPFVNNLRGTFDGK